jgi:ornithine cyclodeaminase/alanine dehydrogenase-like protein (mu-crystallin family)
MDRLTLRITVEEARIAVQLIDPVAVLAEELVGRTIGQPGWGRRHDLPNIGGSNGGELRVAVDGVDCVLPAASMRAFQSAALAALAARELLVPGGVTAALVGTRDAVQSGLAIVARYVPDISHVAVYLTAPRPGALDAVVLDQLELNGIVLSMGTELRQAVFGANLVVVIGDVRAGDLRDLPGTRLAPGAVVVNGTGRDLPAALIDGVDQVYVDDLSLLDACADRYVVRTHTGRPAARHRPPAIRADLGQLLAGSPAGRARTADIVLVELLSVDIPNVWLAKRLHRAAMECGLGEVVEP